MTELRKDAINLLEQMPEDKLYFIVQIMQGVNGLYGSEEQAIRDRAFERLKTLRSIKNIFDMECAAIHPNTSLCLQAITISLAALS